MMVFVIVLSVGVIFLSVAVAWLSRSNKRLKKTFTRLKQSETGLNAIFENVESGISIYQVMDHGRTITLQYMNPAARKIWNVFLEDKSEQPVTQVFPGIEATGLLDVIRRVYHSGDPEHLPTHQYENRQIVDWRENYVYKLPSGNIAVVCNDDNMQQNLLESRECFDVLFHLAPTALLIADRHDFSILHVNTACLRMTGYAETQFQRKTILDPDFLFVPQTLSALEQLKQTQAVSLLDIGFYTSAGEIRNGRFSSQAVTINKKKCIAIAIEDISDFLEALKEKTAAYTHAAGQEKNALVGRVAGKMAHDFNNILGAIMGNAELSLLECQDPEACRTFELILEQTQRGRSLTRNLVTFARDQEPRQDYFDLNEKIVLVLNLLKKDLDGIQVSTRLSEGLPALLADPGMIENALVNMIHNAIHAMSRTLAPHLTVSTDSDGENLIIEIIDNGCGIPAEHRNSIYDPAFTLKKGQDSVNAYDPKIKGTGYGLFNVKKIVEKHKGCIGFDSRIDEGTRFTMSFPVIRQDLTEAERIEIDTTSVLIKHQDILIVEDERSIFDVQHMILTGEPFFHQVDIAQNGEMAMDFLRTKTYDLISLDYLLPGGVTGMDLYHLVRETDPCVPILFVSGNIEFIESIVALKQTDGFVDHLAKPCQNRDYVNAVNQLLSRSKSKISSGV